jgi:hypothetical protein
MSAYEGQIESSSRRAATSAICGLSAFVAVIFAWELIGTVVADILSFAVLPLAAVALILGAVEFILMRRQRVTRDRLTLALIGIISSVLSLPVLYFLLVWAMAA